MFNTPMKFQDDNQNNTRYVRSNSTSINYRLEWFMIIYENS